MQFHRKCLFCLCAILLTVSSGFGQYDSSVSLSGNDLVFTNHNGTNDGLTLSIQSGTNLRFQDPINTIEAVGVGDQVTSHIVDVPIGSIPDSVIINTLGGNDTLTAEFSGGTFSFPIQYDGGDQTTGDDLILKGGTFDEVTHTFISPDSGQVTGGSGGFTIAYNGLEPVLDQLNVTTRTMIFAGGGEFITLSDDTDSGDGESLIKSNHSESLTFKHPTAALVIDNTSAIFGDTIQIRGLDNTYDADLHILGSSSDEVVFENGPTNLNGGSLFAQGLEIDVKHNILTTGTGSIELNAFDNLIQVLSRSIKTDAGSIILTGNKDRTTTTTTTAVSVNGAIETVSGNIVLKGIQNKVDGFASGIVISGTATVRSTGTSMTSSTLMIDGVTETTDDSFLGVLVGGTISSVTSDIQFFGESAAGRGLSFGTNGIAVQSLGTGPNAANIFMKGSGKKEEGVRISFTEIKSIDGDITIEGTNNSPSSFLRRGVNITLNAVVETTGTGPNAGDINMTGFGGFGDGGLNDGVALGNGDVRTVDGNIVITGTARATGAGISVNNTGTAHSTGSGNITLTGIIAGGGNNNGIRSTSDGRIRGGTGDVTLNIDTIEITSSSGNFDGSGNLHFIPLTPTTTIGINNAGTLNFPTTALNKLADGFNTINIGDPASGTGEVIITTATFSDSLNVYGGDFHVNALDAGSNAVQLFSNEGSIASFGGGTDISGATVTLFGEVNPGDTDILAVDGDFTFGSTNTFSVDIDGTVPGSQHDQLAVTGTLNLNGTSLITDFGSAITLSDGDEFVIIDNDTTTDPVISTFDGLAEGALVTSDFVASGFNMQITYMGGDGNDVAIFANSIPTVDAGGPYAVDEGSMTPLAGTASDPGDTITFLWDLDNDGVFGETGAGALYGDENVRNPVFDASSLDGPSMLPLVLAVSDGVITVTDEATITINNVAPTVDAGGPYDVDEGSTTPLAGTGSDPGDTITFLWDLDNDGVFGETGIGALYGDENVQNPVFDASSLDGPSTLPLVLTVSDGVTTVVDGTIITVNNIAPAGDAGGPYNVDEGSTTPLAGTGSDVFDDVTFSWDLDDDEIFGETGSEALFGDEDVQNPIFDASSLDGPSMLPLVLAVSDGVTTAVFETVINIDNVAPVAEAAGPYIVDEGSSISLTGNGSDVFDDVTFAWDLDDDAIFGESGSDALFGDENVRNPIFVSALDGPSTLPLVLAVSDGATTVTDETMITVNNVAPTVDAGGPYDVDEGSTVALTGIGSDAFDDVTFAWDLDGDNTFGETGSEALYGDENVRNPVFDASSLDGPSTLPLVLAVSDGDTTVTDETMITINNVAPTVDAGGPYDVDEGSTIALTGIGSDAFDDVTFAWDLDGDNIFGETGSEALYGDENARNPVFDASTLDGPSTLPLVLAVSDGATTVTDETMITVNNVAPTVDAGGPYDVDEGSTVALTGIGSDAFDDVTFAWDLDDDAIFGESGSDALYGDENIQNPVFDASALGGPKFISVALAVSDGATTVTDEATITINNVAPTVDAGGPYDVDEGSTVALTGAGSDVFDAVTFSWDLDDDAIFGESGKDALQGDENVRNPIFVSAQDGPSTFPLVLAVSDGATTVTDETMITVNNVAPTVDAGGPYDVDEGSTVALTGIGSDAFDDVTFAWDLDDDNIFGETGSEALYGDENVRNPVFDASTLDGPSMLPLILAVSDGDTTVTDETMITVNNVAPTVDAGGPYTVDEGSTVELTGIGSDAFDDVTFAWDLDGDNTFGETGSEALYGDENVRNPVFDASTLDGPSTLPLVLAVSDGDTTVTDEATITINNVAPTVDAGGPYDVDEGSTVELTGIGSDAFDDVTFAWDLDGDNTFGETGSEALYGDENVRNPVFDASTLDGPSMLPLVLAVSDGTTTVTDETMITINNVEPTVDAGGPYTVDEGSTVELTGIGSDAFDDVTFAWDLDDDAIFGESGSNALYGDENLQNPVFNANIDGPDSFNIHLSVSDEATSAVSTTSITINNVLPSVDPGGPYEVAAGLTVTLSGSFNDPFDTPTFAWDLDDDGIFGETGSAAEFGDEDILNAVFDASGIVTTTVRTIVLQVNDGTETVEAETDVTISAEMPDSSLFLLY